MSVLLGNGDGTFQDHMDYATGTYPTSLAMGDFNGDGKPDFVITNFDNDSVSVLLGNGDGTFPNPPRYATGNSPTSVAVGDFNGDGKADLAVPSFDLGLSSVGVLLGNGDGTFQPPWTMRQDRRLCRWRLETSTATARPTWSQRTQAPLGERAAGQRRRHLPSAMQTLRGRLLRHISWRWRTSTATASPTWRSP